MIRSVSLFLVAFSASAWQEPATLDKTQFPSRGEQETLLHVSEPGRYSLQVKSGQGVALELVDQMGGPIQEDGQPGKRDGRLDNLLDAGTYKVRMSAHGEGSGSSTLSVSAFREVTSLPPPALWDNQLISREMDDLQQHSFWIVIDKAEVLRLEILGRNLRDARLWYPGNWLSVYQPLITSYEPLPGRPMTHIEFNQKVPSGTYLLTCYGGPELAWADEDETHPFYLRRALPGYGSFGSHKITVSPFGRESFIVNGQARFHEIIRTDKQDTVLTVRDFEETGSRYGYGYSATINKKSREPHASINTYGGAKWVTVQARPGDVVRYRHFGLDTSLNIYQGGRYWLGSLHGFQARDMFDVTASLSAQNHAGHVIPIREVSLFLDRYNRVARRTNLLGNAELFLNVRQEGTYVVEELTGGTAKGRYQIEPFMLNPPNNYRPPGYSDAGATWPLVKGFHRLTIKPRKEGILNFVIRHQDDPLISGEEPGLMSPNQVGQQVRWPDVLLKDSTNYRFVLNNRSNTPMGAFALKLPLDLSLGLPLNLVKDESITFPVNCLVLASLLFEHEGYSLLVDGIPKQNGEQISAGRHQLTVSNEQGVGADCYLGLAPLQRRLEVPNIRDGSEDLAVLSAQNPLFLDFAQNDHKAFMLEVDQAGLYRIETSGRLATQLVVRTRISTSLAFADRNGIGRNALVQQYLRPGRYLVSAFTLGQSKGRAGLHLNRAELSEGGDLRPNEVAKTSLTGDAAIRYRVTISEPGAYQLETLGLSKRFPTRFEDADGYPLVRPGRSETLNEVLSAGVYSYYSLPAPVASRRLTRLTPVPKEKVLTGKGPFPLAVNQAVHHTWRKGAADRYSLVILAPIEGTIRLTAGMSLTLLRGNEKVLETRALSTPTGRLAAGNYAVEVRRLEEDDRFPYTFSLNTQWLAPGISQTVTGAVDLQVSLAESALVDLFSFGDTDVKAVLKNDDGFFSERDDSLHDWNIHFSQVVPGGLSRLEVSLLGSENGPVTFHLQPRRDTKLARQGLPFELDQKLAKTVLTQPFTAKADGLYHFAAEGDNPISLALSRDGQILGQQKGSLEIPLRAGPYSLMVWAEGGSPRVHVSASKSKLSEKNIKGKTRLRVGHTLLTSDIGPASYRLEGKAWFSPDWQRPLQPLADNFVNLYEGRGWLRTESPAELTEIDLTVGLSVALDEARFCFQASRKDKRPMLLEVVSVSTGPGCAAGNSAGPDWGATLTMGNRAWTALPDKGDYTVTVWKTTSGEGRDRFELIPHLFETGPPIDLNREVSGTLAAGAALTLRVPPGTRTELILGKGLIVADHGDNRTHSMIGAISANLQKIHPVRGDRLILFNSGPAEALYRVAVTERKDPVFHADLGGLNLSFEQVFDKSGTLLLNLPGSDSDPSHIFLSGDEVVAELLSARGPRIPIDQENGTPSESGQLVVSHGAGLVSVRLANPDDLGEMTAAMNHKPEKTNGPYHALNGKARTWAIHLDEPTWLRIDTDVAGKTILSRNKRVLYQSASADPMRCTLQAYLPAGNYGLHAGPLPGQPARGSRHLQRIKPLLLDEKEASGPRLIAGDEVHVYRFKVTDAGKVGVGLKTESDRLQARLFDVDSQLLASGPFVLRQLEPGEYLLVVEARGAPVSYQPLLYGNRGPGTRIPDNVLLQYVKE